MFKNVNLCNEQQETKTETKEMHLYPTAIEEKRWFCFIEFKKYALMRW